MLDLDPGPDLGLGCIGAQHLCSDFGRGVGKGGNRSHRLQPAFVPGNLGDKQQKSDPAVTVPLPDIFLQCPALGCAWSCCPSRISLIYSLFWQSQGGAENCLFVRESIL